MGLSKEFRTNKMYSEELKKEAVFKVLSGELRKSEAIEAYGIKGSPSLDRWLERYGHGILSEHKELLEHMGTRRKKESVKVEMPEAEELRQQVGKLKKDLRAAELRAEAYSMMIDIAERELKVAIRKKSATK
jgi:transposase-like protein